MDGKFFLVFLLMALLIMVAYYTGVGADAASLSAAARNLIYALTGRDQTGAFAKYP